MYRNILRELGYDIGMVLPSHVFFKPNEHFLKEMSKMNSPIIEMGAGMGYALKKMQDYGEEHNIGCMINARGFDINQRTEYYADMIHTVDALDCPFYHKNFTVLVCRPDHSGWFYDLLELFLNGTYQCKRLIYVGLPKNIPIDIGDDYYMGSTGSVSDVGEEGEIMITWEFNHD